MRKEKLDELHEYIEELKTIRRTLVERKADERGFLNVEKYMVELANGMVVPREKITKGKADKSAAIILPITEDNNTILVVQSRSSTLESVSVELPAGYIEQEETPIAGAERELLEETGYLPKRLILLDKFYQDQSCGVCAYNYSFLAQDCKKVQDQSLDKDEALRFFECSIPEAMELMQQGYITDIQSKYTLNLAKPYIYQKTNARPQK